jgi:hypothetical protein
LSLSLLLAAMAAIALCIHLYTSRVREGRQRRFRPIAQEAARRHHYEAVRIERMIDFERGYTLGMPQHLARMKKSGHESETRGGFEYIAGLRDILPWHERWLDLQRRAKGYYSEFEGQGTPKPEWAAELARAQDKLLEDRRTLIAHHPGVAGLRVYNPMIMINVTTIGPRPPEYIKVPDPFDIQDAPDFLHPGHTFEDVNSEGP